MKPASRTMVSGERRIITALFCDVVGSTSLAESMDPEDWSEVVGHVLDRMASVIEHYGGTVSDFGGDALVAIFGAPVAHEDDPYRAVRTGLELISEIHSAKRDGQTPLDVRVGINTGLTVVGEIGAGAMSTYSALGDTLNVASRLQSLAHPGTVYLSGETRRLLGPDVDLESIGEQELRGRGAKVDVFRAVSIHGNAGSARGIPGLTSPMVGRDAELAVLADLIRTSAAGLGRVAAIMGEPGVGKSRLVADLQGSSVEHSPLWAFGRSVEFESGEPYRLASSLLRSLAGLSDTESREVVRKSMTELAGHGGDQSQSEWLERLAGVDVDADEGTAEQLQAGYREALENVLRGLANVHKPVILVCEDVHWADASSVNLLIDMLQVVSTSPLLMLLVLRPDSSSAGWTLVEAARRDLGESFTEIRLAPLAEAASRLLISNLLSVDSLPSNLRKLILASAEGNPLFVEELVRMLIETGIVVEADRRWVATSDLDALAVPDTVQGLLNSRVDLLQPEVRQAGRVAAAIGKTFSARVFGHVSSASGQAEEVLHPHLATLEAHGMIRVDSLRPELKFSFRHALITKSFTRAC